MAYFKIIQEKVLENQRLSFEDGVYLYREASLLELGQLADMVNRQKNSHDVFYNINRHINPTNICVKSCKFCAYSRKPGEEGAYEYSTEEILEKAREVAAQGATEVHMVGGLHPRWNFNKYLEILGALKANFPQLHIKAFTAVEIDWLAAKARLSIKDTLSALQQAGLDSMPGGGAEIFHPDIRTKICDTKTDAARWLDIHRQAHQLGIRSNCTMLYGHIEQFEHRVDHMQRLRELQDETNGFNVFIPLSFQPQDNQMGINRYTPGIDDLKNIAVARLFLDNFRHIKAYWIMLGQDIAQLALSFGANDLDGTVTEEKISRMAGGRSGMNLNKKRIHGIIRKAQRIPVERDTLYHPIWRDQSDRDKDALTAAKQDEVNFILYRSENSEALSSEQALTIAEYGDLFHLGHGAAMVKQRLLATRMGGLAVSLPILSNDDFENAFTFNRAIAEVRQQCQPAALEYATLPIDLSHPDFVEIPFTVDKLLRYIKLAKAHSSQLNIAVSGVKRIWNLAIEEKISLADLVNKMAAAGVDTIESSIHESEDDLTSTEVIEFHRTCHLQGIPTLGKLELSATYSGPGQPFWQEFVNRCAGFRALQEETGLVLALKVEAAKGSYITPNEYLRALAVSRIFVDNVGHILAPFLKIPTLSPRSEASTAKNAEPAMKIAPLVLHFGASDLGMLPVTSHNPFELMEELKLSGLTAEFRNARFEQVNII